MRPLTKAEAAPLIAILNSSTGLDWYFRGNKHFAAEFTLDAWHPVISSKGNHDYFATAARQERLEAERKKQIKTIAKTALKQSGAPRVVLVLTNSSHSSKFGFIEN